VSQSPHIRRKAHFVPYSTAQGPKKKTIILTAELWEGSFLSSSQITLLSSLLQTLGFHANNFTQGDESHQTWGSSLMFFLWQIFAIFGPENLVQLM
jgi:hypothetical protein